MRLEPRPLRRHRCTRRARVRGLDRVPRTRPGRERRRRHGRLRPRLPEPRPRRAGDRSAKDALQLVEEALVVAVVVLGEALLELLEEPPLLVGQPARHAYVHEDPLVTPPESLEHRHAAPAQDADLPGLRPRLELQRDIALECRNRDLGAQRRLRHRQVDGGEDVVSFANEPLVGHDPNEHEEVSGSAAQRAGVTFAAEPDPLPVVDPRRDLDAERTLLDDASAARAAIARSLHDGARTAAARARLRPHELAERASRDVLEIAAALALRTSRRAGARLCAVPPTAPARDARPNRNLARRAGGRLHELDLHLRCDVGAASLRAAAPRSPEEVVAEERGEDVGEVAEVELRRCEPAAPQPRVPIAVVHLTSP